MALLSRNKQSRKPLQTVSGFYQNNRKLKPESIAKAIKTKQANGHIRTSSVLLTYGGETLNLSATARKYQISRATLVTRLKNGWTVESAIETPIRSKAPARAQE